MKSFPTPLRLGLGLLLFGTGPLLLFVAADGLGLISDPNPNPVGLGLLFAVSFLPAVILTLVGVAMLILRRLSR